MVRVALATLSLIEATFGSRDSIGCPPAGAEKPRWGRLYIFAGFVLSCRPREDSDSRIETLEDFPRAKRSQNLFWIAMAKAAA